LVQPVPVVVESFVAAVVAAQAVAALVLAVLA
jgi:hypothetical protein